MSTKFENIRNVLSKTALETELAALRIGKGCSIEEAIAGLGNGPVDTVSEFKEVLRTVRPDSAPMLARSIALSNPSSSFRISRSMLPISGYARRRVIGLGLRSVPPIFKGTGTARRQGTTPTVQDTLKDMEDLLSFGENLKMNVSLYEGSFRLTTEQQVPASMQAQVATGLRFADMACSIATVLVLAYLLDTKRSGRRP